MQANGDTEYSQTLFEDAENNINGPIDLTFIKKQKAIIIRRIYEIVEQ